MWGGLFSGVGVELVLLFYFFCGKFKHNTNLNIRIYSHNPTSIINLVHVLSVCLSTPFFLPALLSLGVFPFPRHLFPWICQLYPHCVSFLKAAITNYHKFGGLKQHKFILTVVMTRSLISTCWLVPSWGKSTLYLFPSIWWQLAVLGVALPVDASLQFLFPYSHALASVCLSSPSPFCCQSLDLGPTL